MAFQKQAHLPVLDGVRGLAILLVVLFHSTFIPRIDFLDKIWHVFAFTGWVGVDLFFVLSGFLITRILVSEKGSESYFLNFYARRFLRIVPLYYLFLFGIFYVLREPVQFGFTYWTFLSNILVSRLGYFPSPSLDMAWSLAVEEQFYLVWPFIILLTNEKQLGRICKILFLAALALRLLFFFTHTNLLTNYVLLPTRTDSLAAGAWLAVSYRTLPPKFCTKAFWYLTPFTMAIFAVDVSHSSPLMQTIGFSFNALLSVFLIGSLMKNETAVFFAFFQNSFLKTLGKYSYGMYLFHVPVTHWIFQKGKTFWSAAPETLGAGFPIQVLFHAAALLGTLGVAFVSYQLYEKQFLKLKKYFESSPEVPDPSSLTARL